MKTFRRLVIILWLTLSLLNLNGNVYRWFMGKNFIQRAGIKYCIKGWLANWELHWLVK